MKGNVACKITILPFTNLCHTNCKSCQLQYTLYDSKEKTQKFKYEMFLLFPTSYKNKIIFVISPRPPFWKVIKCITPYKHVALKKK